MNKIQITVNKDTKTIEGFVDGCKDDLRMDLRKMERRGLIKSAEALDKICNLDIKDSYRVKVTLKEPDEWKEESTIRAVKDKIIALIEQEKAIKIPRLMNTMSMEMNSLFNRATYCSNKSNDFFEKFDFVLLGK